MSPKSSGRRIFALWYNGFAHWFFLMGYKEDFTLIKKCISIGVVLCLCATIFAQNKPDALAMYREARNYEASGQTIHADSYYNLAVNICLDELKVNPKNMESYVVLCWSLFRLKKYAESERYSLEALKINEREYRIMENLGETYFYLKRYDDSLRYLERYVDGAPNGDRASTAYFFIGEIYRIKEKFNHADISYSLACRKESSIALWWYRLGTVREKAGYKDGAKTAYQKALSLSKNNYPEAQAGLNRLG